MPLLSIILIPLLEYAYESQIWDVAKIHKRLLYISAVVGGVRAQGVWREQWDTVFNCHGPAKNLTKRFLLLHLWSKLDSWTEMNFFLFLLYIWLTYFLIFHFLLPSPPFPSMNSKSCANESEAKNTFKEMVFQLPSTKSEHRQLWKSSSAT